MEGKITKQPALLLRSSVRPHTVAHFQVTDGRLALELLQALLFSSTYADERTALSFLYDPKPVSQAKGLQFLKGFERIKTQPVLFRLNLWVKPKPKPKPAVVHLLLITNSDIFPLVFLLKEAFVLDIRSSAIRRNISYTRGSPPPPPYLPHERVQGRQGLQNCSKGWTQTTWQFSLSQEKSKANQTGMVAYPFNTSTLETEADASLFESSLVYVRVSGQAPLHTETLCPAKIFKLF